MSRLLSMICLVGVFFAGVLLAKAVDPASAPADSATGKSEIPATLYLVNDMRHDGPKGLGAPTSYLLSTYELFIPSLKLAIINGRPSPATADRYAGAIEAAPEGTGVQRVADFKLSLQEIRSIEQTLALQQELDTLSTFAPLIGSADTIIVATIDRVNRSGDRSELREDLRDWELSVQTKAVLYGASLADTTKIHILPGMAPPKVGDSYILFLQTKRDSPVYPTAMIPATDSQIALIGGLAKSMTRLPSTTQTSVTRPATK